MRFFKAFRHYKFQDSFLPALLAFLAATIFYNNYFTRLDEVTNGIIGIATYDGVDIAARIKKFYYTAFILTAGFILFSCVLQLLFRKLNFSYRDRIHLNTISFFSLSAITASFLVVPALTTVCFTLITLPLATTIFLITPATRKTLSWNKIVYAIIACFLSQILVIDAARILSFAVNETGIVLWGIVFYLLALIITNRKTDVNIWPLIPLTGIPILYPLSVELFFAFEKNEATAISKIYLILIALMLLWVGLRFFRSKRKNFKRHSHTAIGFWLVCSAAVTAGYNHLPSANIENFELANPANAMMNIFKYHKLPIVDFYSSHLLSEQLYGVVYFLLHGYDASLDFMSFYFLVPAAAYAALYFFLYKVFRKVWIILFFILFIPFLPEAIFPRNYFIVLLCFLAMAHYMRSPDMRRFFLLVITAVLAMFWRVDSAVVALPAIGITLFIWAYHTNKSRQLLRTAGIVGMITILIAGVAFIVLHFNGHNIPDNFKSALEYIGASQAHGYSEIMTGETFRLNTVYYILPAVSIFLAIILWIRFYQKKEKLSDVLLIIFFTTVYILNFQRGLVRHTLGNEGTDKFLVSYIFFLLPYAILMLLKIRRHKLWAFVLVSFFFVTAFKVPLPTHQYSLADAAFDNVRQSNFHLSNEQPRISEWQDHKNNFAGIDSFFTINFSKDASFVDVSNTPLLYYILQRPVPGYFCQYIQNMVTASTQQRNVLALKQKNLPVTIFSSYPEHDFFDRTDGVENGIRYHKISNYVFNNYRPLGVLDGKYLWIKKDVQTLRYDNTKRLPDSVVFAVKEFDISRLAYLWAKNKIKENKQGSALVSNDKNFWIFPDKFSKKDGNYAIIEIINNTGTSHQLTASYIARKEVKGLFRFWVSEEREASYLVPLSTQYNWYVFTHDGLQILLPSEGLTIKSVSLFENL